MLTLIAEAVAPTPVPLTQVLTSGGEVLTTMLGWIPSVANTIVSNGLIFLTVGMLIAGAVVALLKRLLRRG